MKLLNPKIRITMGLVGVMTSLIMLAFFLNVIPDSNSAVRQGRADLAEAIAQVSDYPYPPIDTGCLYSGQLIDWASDHGIAAVDIELRTHTDTDFAINLPILDVLLSWSYPH